MNIDIEYYHARAFRLTAFTTYAELYDLTNNASVRVELADLPTVRGLSADGMRALIEAGRLAVPQAPKGPVPEEGKPTPAIGDIWLTRRGTYAAVVYGRIGEDKGGRLLLLTAVELLGPHPRTFEVDKEGGFIGKGTGERHPLDFVKRDKGFL